MAALNDKECGTCNHYDPIMRGKTAQGGVRETNWAWCAKKSAYPAQEGPGQKFPEEVTRVAAGQLAKPFIVRRLQVVTNCCEYAPRGNKLSKSDLLKQLQDKTGGRIVGF